MVFWLEKIIEQEKLGNSMLLDRKEAMIRDTNHNSGATQHLSWNGDDCTGPDKDNSQFHNGKTCPDSASQVSPQLKVKSVGLSCTVGTPNIQLPLKPLNFTSIYLGIMSIRHS